ncbi:hypothetical protein QA641_09400 [Bradyrhizobium sp. CB1650]|uniref:hypothetical protein n=1 Tax=Bradyrhizobium sp. CB1650 TaxID=3039153 RepID=UPI002435CE53|nr:hypothetical protein [Bradyrhizobium sp. CB1650]WGD54095.1 hypothetical protein QA641_09400 [Bradyrhizobium sp. CB1650]
MSDDAKDAGLVAMISSILGGGKRTDAAEPPPLAEVPPTAPTNGLEAVAAQIADAAPLKREDASNGAVASVKLAEPPHQIVTQSDGKRRLPAQALADLVLGELRKIEDFPASGVSITVYGYRHWNAMITFAPFSTTFRDATRFRKALPDIVFKLRRYVDLEI